MESTKQIRLSLSIVIVILMVLRVLLSMKFYVYKMQHQKQKYQITQDDPELVFASNCSLRGLQLPVKWKRYLFLSFNLYYYFIVFINVLNQKYYSRRWQNCIRKSTYSEQNEIQRVRNSTEK